MCMCMCKFSYRCRCRCRYRYMGRCRCRCLTLMAPVSWLMAKLLLVSSSSAQSTSRNLRTGLTSQSMLLPRTSTSSSREAVRLTVMGQARGVQGGTAVTQVTEED